MTSNFLELKGLHKKFDQITALNNVSLKIVPPTTSETLTTSETQKLIAELRTIPDIQVEKLFVAGANLAMVQKLYKKITLVTAVPAASGDGSYDDISRDMTAVGLAGALEDALKAQQEAAKQAQEKIEPKCVIEGLKNITRVIPLQYL